MLAKAKTNVREGISQVKHWWTTKYRLPPNHELFEKQSFGELTLEMFEDMLLKREEITEQLEVADTKHANELYRQLNAINAALGEAEQVQDELVEQWERDLEAGKVPDLEAR